jgi:hypothetical protein
MPLDGPFRRPVLRCELCNREAGAGGLTRCAGLDLCRACAGGDLGPALGRWGLTLEPDGVAWSGRLDLDLRFSRERLKHRLRRVLGLGDHENGDETFDDEVWVGGEVGHHAGDLLAGEGVRQAIGEALETASEITLAPGRVTATATGERLPLVALAVHVTRFIRRERSHLTRRDRDSRVPLGRKVCRHCGGVSFERVARCPACGAGSWWP